MGTPFCHRSAAIGERSADGAARRARRAGTWPLIRRDGHEVRFLPQDLARCPRRRTRGSFALSR